MTARKLVVWWVYAAIFGHLVVGALLPLAGGAALFEGCHAGIESAFWPVGAPDGARALQLWWVALFGPTVQAAAIWMGALAYIGERQRNALAWGSLIAGIVLWAPQDIYLSLQRGVWANVLIDCFALMTMLPPLVWLYLQDRQKASAA
ncbi:cell division protein [Massilia glaciei]|uniref:cell division protein n=1 Tax=Massilia glaciei TaxID=1524097 RepID=UPI001E5E31D8|nr:cell division protein [Massilia glaciei]